VLLSAAAFWGGAYYQGRRSAILIAVYGLLFGILAETRKSLRPGMMTHAWHDGFAGISGQTAGEVSTRKFRAMDDGKHREKKCWGSFAEEATLCKNRKE